MISTEHSDNRKNSPKLLETIAEYQVRTAQRELFPLRIDHRTVLMVPREKCNEAYRQEYLQRINGKSAEIYKNYNPKKK